MKAFLTHTWGAVKTTATKIKDKFSLMCQCKDCDKEGSYKDLAPIDEISNGNEYLKALHWAITNHRVKNIALTGPYGSGKSSIINAYLKRHPLIKAKHLRISMATFIESEAGETGEPKRISLKPEQIQEGILKQLFYKVNHRRIPQSRYRKLYRVGLLSIWGNLALATVAIAVFVFVFAPEQFNDIVTSISNAGQKLGISQMRALKIFGSFILVIITALAVILRQLYSRIRVNEVKVKDATIVPDKKDNESIFNKNMDEIVYFFEETQYRVVFFEDLDRLDSSEIFVQLRELNTLLNNSNTIKRPIVFVYAVKDDIFTEEDRTKFFEFIIPVIPVINSTNSGEILSQLFEANDGKATNHDITLDYILDVSPYISDMRILQNIYNEFLLYKRTLRTGQGLELTDQMMLSIIIFKNLFPKDFADLQMEKGIVKDAFNDKCRYIEAKQKSLQDAIETSTNLINCAKNEVLHSTREIKASMLAALTGWSGFATSIEKIQGADSTAQQIMEESYDFASLLTNNTGRITCRDWRGNGNYWVQAKDLEDVCRKYYERYKNLKTHEENALVSIQEEVERNKLIQQQISGWSIKKLIEVEGDEALFSETVKKNKLLIFMLRKGYIDEKYVDYVNYFQGSSITTDDMNYILGVKNHEGKPFDYSVSKVSQVVRRLLPHEFAQRETLNFDVLNYLLESTDCEDKLSAMIKCISDGSETSWQFIDQFVRQTSHIPRFIKLLSQSWDNIWRHIYHDPVLTYSRKTYYLSILCANAEVETLETLNEKDGLISQFFEEHDDILQKLSSVEPEKMVSIIPKLDVSFSKLKIENVDPDVLNCIFDNYFYSINPDMIHSIVAYKNRELCSHLQKQNYSTVITLGYTPLIEYIHANLPFYIDNIVLNGVNNNENINQIIDMLNRSIDDVERCKRIIQSQEFTMSNISACCIDQYSDHRTQLKEIWDMLLNCGKVEPTWENVDVYWSHFGLSPALSEYIKTTAEILVQRSSACLDDALRKELFQTDIIPPIFTMLLPHLHLADFNVLLENILEENVDAIIKDHFLVFSAEKYKELSLSHPTLCKVFILENPDDFLEEMKNISVKSEVFEGLVLSTQAGIAFKERIIKEYGASLMSKVVAEYICSRNFPVQKDVFDAAWKILDISKKKALMIGHLNILKAEDFEVCFSELGTEYQELADRSRRHNVLIPKSEEHRSLAKRLQQVDYITSYDDKETMREFDHVLRKSAERPAILCRVKVDSSKNTTKQ